MNTSNLDDSQSSWNGNHSDKDASNVNSEKVAYEDHHSSEPAPKKIKGPTASARSNSTMSAVAAHQTNHFTHSTSEVTESTSAPSAAALSGSNANATGKSRSTTNATTTPTAATATTANSSTAPFIVKKRPYIRTKRPAGYNDKSSITTTTDALWRSPLNVYDAVLQESNDLLQAASEAQQLGRLKMASAYLFLLHARLVGLGKRFDKAPPLSDAEAARVAAQASATTARSCTTGRTSAHRTHDTMTSAPLHPQPPPAGRGSHPVHDATTATTHATNATHALAQFLPSNIELDTAMMEHLARAAAELHAARCSGRHQFPVSTMSEATRAAMLSTAQHSPVVVTWPDGPLAGTPNRTMGPPASTPSTRKRSLLQSPNVGEFLASTANQRGVTNAATVTGVARVRLAPHAAPAGHAATATASYTSRTFGTQWGGSHTGTGAPHDRPSLVGPNDAAAHVAAAPTTPGMDASTATTSFTPNTSGVRCKPVTTAMNTVPHANCNARALLQGASLFRQANESNSSREPTIQAKPQAKESESK